MRTIFTWFVLFIVTTICIGDSLSNNKDNNPINKQPYQSITPFTRRLLTNEAKALRKKRKQEARKKVHKQIDTGNKKEIKKETKDTNVNNDPNNGVDNNNSPPEIDNNQPQEKIYRDYESDVMDTIHKYINNNNENNAENNDNINDQNIDEINGNNNENNEKINENNNENNDKNNDAIPEVNAVKSDNFEDKTMNKRIYRYKFKNGMPNFEETVNENNVNYREDISDNNNNNIPSNNNPLLSVPEPIVKSFKSSYDTQIFHTNETWSKRTFWLLFCILIINICALLYCSYGKQIRAYINAINQISNVNIKSVKTLTDSDSDDDTTDEQYIE